MEIIKEISERNNCRFIIRWYHHYIIFLIFKEINVISSISSSHDNLIPHPQTQFKICSRSKPSFVCDPENILNAGEADKLDFFAKEMLEDTPCLCSICNTNNNGVKIGILIKQNHSSISELGIKDLAKQVRRKWKLGSCSDDIVIVLLTANEQSSFDMGDTVQYVISSQLASKVFQDCVGHFTNGNYYQGLESMINSFRDILQRFQKIRPELTQRKTGSIIGISLGVCILIAISTTAIILRCWHVRKRMRKSNSKYAYTAAGSELNNNSFCDEDIDSDIENEKHENNMNDNNLPVPPKFSNSRVRQLSDVAEEAQDDEEIEILKFATSDNPRNRDMHVTEL